MKMGVIQYAREKLNDYVAEKLGAVGEILAAPISTAPKIAMAVAAAAYSSGCAAIPMYDTANERELMRLENKATTGNLTLCGRAEMRGISDEQVDIESLVARGIAEFAVGDSGFHLVGNHIAKPGKDITNLGLGYRGKIGNNTVWHVQAKYPVSSEGSLELEGFVLRNGKRAKAYIRARGYPETGKINVESALQGKVGNGGPFIELDLVGDASNPDSKVLTGWRFNL